MDDVFSDNNKGSGKHHHDNNNGKSDNECKAMGKDKKIVKERRKRAAAVQLQLYDEMIKFLEEVSHGYTFLLELLRAVGMD